MAPDACPSTPPATGGSESSASETDGLASSLGLDLTPGYILLPPRLTVQTARTASPSTKFKPKSSSAAAVASQQPGQPSSDLDNASSNYTKERCTLPDLPSVTPFPTPLTGEALSDAVYAALNPPASDHASLLFANPPTVDANSLFSSPMANQQPQSTLPTTERRHSSSDTSSGRTLPSSSGTVSTPAKPKLKVSPQVPSDPAIAARNTDVWPEEVEVAFWEGTSS